MKWYLSIILIALTLSACSSGGWIQKNPVFVDSGVYLQNMDQTEFSISDGLLEDFKIRITESAADSIGRTTIQQMISSYARAGITSAKFVDEMVDADYVMRVDKFEIKWVPTANVSHPGPVYRVSISASAWIGNEKVFESSHSADGNISYVAAEGRRFYIPSEEDRIDPVIQRDTIFPAIRSAYGKVWEEFLKAGDRR
jgi:hypothetical protein